MPARKERRSGTGAVMGFDHEALTYPYAGGDFRMTDVAGTVARDVMS